MTPPAQPLFSVRLVAGWLAAAALTCAVSLTFLVRDDGPAHRPDEAGPTIYSRSALGYAALYHTLGQLGVPVGENTAESMPMRGVAVVVIAEPSDEQSVLAHVRDTLRRAPAVLLVLPKHRGKADPERPWMLRSDRLLPLESVQRVLTVLDDRATVDRFGAVRTWSGHEPLPTAPDTNASQLVHGNLEPLVSSRDGVLAGQTLHRRIVVVSDPDIFENHGIARGDNARIAVALLQRLRGDGTGRVVFDEVPHGYVSHPLGIVRLLFTFPFVLVTLQIALAVGLLMWSAAARFGAPRQREPALPLGKRSLVEGGSRLLAFGGRLPYVLGRYAEALLRETAARVHAPRGLTPPELAAWFDRTGRPVPAVAAAPAAAPDVSAALEAAQSMYRWRNDVADEPG